MSVTTKKKQNKATIADPIAELMIDNLITVSVSGRRSLSCERASASRGSALRDHFSVACDVKIQMTRDRRLG